MELVVDLTSGTVVLREPDDTQRFSVQVVRREDGDDDALAAALRAHDAGTVEPGGDVLVPEAAVRRLAGRSLAQQGRTPGPEWDTGLAAMLEYAATRGWVTDDGAIRAHVEWRN